MDQHLLEARRAASISEPEMHVVYVVLLKPDAAGKCKWYVCKTYNLMNRLHIHIMGNARSAAWVRRWGGSGIGRNAVVLRRTECDYN